MTPEHAKLRDYINRTVPMEQILKEFYGIEVAPGTTIFCPFHNDNNRKSAKFHPDNAIYCFAESKTFRPWDVLLMQGMTVPGLMARFGADAMIAEDTKPVVVSSVVYFDLRNQLRAKPFSIAGVVAAWSKLFEGNDEAAV